MNSSQNRSSTLTVALMLSLVLNLVLIGALAYLERQQSVVEEQLEFCFAGAPRNMFPTPCAKRKEEIWSYVRSLSFKQLVKRLSDDRMAADGYLKRDFALACLVHHHHLDIRKALPGTTLMPRTEEISSVDGGVAERVKFYPGLGGEHFRKVSRFAHEVTWPFTHKGLFQSLQECDISEAPSLRKAFYLTPEFRAVEALFQGAGMEIHKGVLIRILVQGDWEHLQNWYRNYGGEAPSTESRRQFLSDYLALGSTAAAQLWLQADFDHILAELDDATVIRILELAPDELQETERLALALLKGPRGEAVWMVAARHLYQIVEEELPNPYSHAVALRRFAPELALPGLVAEQDQGQPAYKCHEVMPGETLWRIAKRYGVTMETLMEVNGLQSYSLRPGDQLWIPR